jgi:hypothetical protein
VTGSRTGRIQLSSRHAIRSHLARRADTMPRATRVPQAGVNNGHQGSPLTTADHRSMPGPGQHSRVPKLPTKCRCLRRGLAPGWPRTGPDSERPPGARGVPSRRLRKPSGPGAGVQVVQRRRCSTWTPAPGPLQDKAADATGYLLLAPAVLQTQRRDPHPTSQKRHEAPGPYSDPTEDRVISGSSRSETKSPQIGILVDQSVGGELRRTSAAWVTHKSARNCWPRVS